MNPKYDMSFSSPEEENQFIKEMAARFEQKADEKKKYWNSVTFSQQITLLQNYVNNNHPANSIDELFPNDEFSTICNTIFEFCESKPYKEDHMSAEYKGLLFVMYQPIIQFDVFKADQNII